MQQVSPPFCLWFFFFPSQSQMEVPLTSSSEIAVQAQTVTAEPGRSGGTFFNAFFGKQTFKNSSGPFEGDTVH